MMDGMTNKDGMHTGNRPCEYKFKRYIGQPVSVWNRMMDEYIHGTIVDIKPYYTEVCVGDGRTLMCTPHGDFRPLKPMPWLPERTSFGAMPKCDNCKGCDNYKSGWVCGSWEEVEAQPAEQIEWRF